MDASGSVQHLTHPVCYLPDKNTWISLNHSVLSRIAVCDGIRMLQSSQLQRTDRLFVSCCKIKTSFTGDVKVKNP